jgi:TM2 domain-containing membrane protein YozV
MSPKKRTLTAVHALFFGIFGAHRFYVGKTRSAILQLLTIGGLGIWAAVDLIIILFGGFTDEEGLTISEWS